MSQEQSESFAALQEALAADFLGLLVEHRDAILEGLFSGDDSPDWTYQNPKDRTLN